MCFLIWTVSQVSDVAHGPLGFFWFFVMYFFYLFLYDIRYGVFFKFIRVPFLTNTKCFLVKISLKNKSSVVAIIDNNILMKKTCMCSLRTLYSLKGKWNASRINFILIVFTHDRTVNTHNMNWLVDAWSDRIR